MRKRTLFLLPLLFASLHAASCKKAEDGGGGDKPRSGAAEKAVSGLGSRASSEALEAWRERYQAIEEEPRRFEFIAEMVARDDDQELPSRIAIALDDPSPRIRREAMAAVSSMAPKVSYGLLMKALEDSDDFVRDYALGDIRQLPEQMKMDAYRAGLASEHADVKDKAVRSLANLRTPEAFGYLLEGLKDESPEVRESVGRQVNALVEQQFASHAEAEAWWAANKERYDERLLPLDDCG